MTVRLPEELEKFIRKEVESGQFASEDEAVADAVRAWVQHRLANPDKARALTEEELEQRLTQSGLLGSVPPPPTGPVSRAAFQPIPIKGQPLSETVIHERR
jgi:Arc/MetJ-type ribon-helix-helix transcriptional regulator